MVQGILFLASTGTFEVFFRVVKSYLALAKEFQVRSYNMMLAHTTIVFMRYAMLALESRNSSDPRTIGDLFFYMCDEAEDIKVQPGKSCRES
jgi:hypothetical protein